MGRAAPSVRRVPAIHGSRYPFQDNGFLLFDCRVAFRRASSAILIDNPQPVAYAGPVFYSVRLLREAVELRDALRLFHFRAHPI